MDSIKDLTEKNMCNHELQSQTKTYSLQDFNELSIKQEPSNEYCMNGCVSENNIFLMNESTVIVKRESDDETMIDSSEERDDQDCLFHHPTGTYTF